MTKQKKTPRAQRTQRTRHGRRGENAASAAPSAFSFVLTKARDCDDPSDGSLTALELGSLSQPFQLFGNILILESKLDRVLKRGNRICLVIGLKVSFA